MSTIKYEDVKPGDLVRLEKGEVVLRGRVTVYDSGPWLDISGSFSLVSYEREGYALFLIEKAKPELPDEPGLNAVVIFEGFVPLVHKEDGWIFVSWLNLPESDFTQPMTWEQVFERRKVENYSVLWEDRA